MSTNMPEYSLEEILSVIARSILSNPNSYSEEDYELLDKVSSGFYVLKEE